MMSQPETTIVGARVLVHPTDGANNCEHTITMPSVVEAPPSANAHSSHSTDEVPDFDPTIGAKPFSPFYRHATTKASEEQLKVEVKIASRGYNSQDLESGSRSVYKQSMDANGRTSKLWAKDKRHCGWMDSMTKKQKIAVKAFLAVLIIGGMIGIALGITAAVGGGVWRSNHRQSSIGGHT
jgi:hypothetical protein